MTQLKESKITPLIETFSEATTACLVTMVQGNFLAMTLTHLAIASQTGIVAGLLTTAAILFSKTRNRWIIAGLLGAITAIADYFIHDATFGPVALEAVVTGIGAAVLSLIVSFCLDRWFRSRANA